jgi:cell wall-associated NlpC family hydrolase
MDFDHNLPQPGDILLLRGKSLFTKPNMVIQSITRLQISSYSHVAIVTGQNMIMDAMPGIGITMRQWDEVSHSYDVANSLLVRHRTADPLVTQDLVRQANYYYGQRYNLIAFIGNEPKFSDNKGIVCSQFVAQVFQDCNLSCSEKPCRKTLPTDIHTFVTSNPEWIQRPLSEVEIGLSHYTDEISHSMAYSTHQLDNYIAASVKQAFDFSRMFHKLTAHIADLTNTASFTDSSLIPVTLRMANSSKTDISIEHLTASWRHYFLEPKARATFLHEDGPAADKQVTVFIKVCEIIKQHSIAADDALNHLQLSTSKFEELANSLPPDPTEIEIRTWIANHNEFRRTTQHQIDILDWIFTSDPNNIDFAKNFDFQALMEEYGKNPRPDYNEAADTLAIIANYCLLCDCWIQQLTHYEKIMNAHNAADDLTKQ